MKAQDWQMAIEELMRRIDRMDVRQTAADSMLATLERRVRNIEAQGSLPPVVSTAS